MLKFRKFISEEVIPTASVSDGSIDLEKPAVRGQINATLAGVTARPCVTPYVALHKIMKALAYFSIVIPRKTYMEGDRGVEVYELNQFGHRMGMTDQGEFVHEVPNKYFLFLQYRTMEPMGVIYAKPTVGGMFKVTAKVVDQVELDKLLSMAELSLAEDANLQQQKAKVMAPKEPVKPGCHDGTESTKQAIEVSMRRKDKKLSADSLDEAHKVTGVKGSEKGDRYEMRTHAPGEHHEWSSIVKTHQGGKSTQNQWGGHPSLRTGKTGYVKKHFDKLEEKLTKGMSPADVISDFVHSDDPKFKGKSKKERMKMALGAYYGMHPEKSRKD